MIHLRYPSFKRRFIPLLLMCGLAIGFVAAILPFRARASPAAVLSGTEGEVEIERGKDRLIGAFGAPLEKGDIVVTGAKGKATLLFPTGKVYQVGPASRVVVSDVARADGGDLLVEVPEVSGQDAPIFAQAAATEQGLAAVPNLRSGGAELEVVSPRNTKVRPGSIAFRWTGVEDALEYAVILNGPGSAAGRHRAADLAWTAPSDAFHPGQRWTWSVEAMTADGPVASNPASFEVASEAAAAELTMLEATLEPLLLANDPIRSDTGAWLLGTYCRSLGFYADAIAHLESLVDHHDERKEVYRQLGSLYQAVGLDHLAAEAYRRALID